MIRRAPRTVTLTLLAAASAACAPPRLASNTGYLGTWSRGNDRVVSIVAIARDDAGYRFRWTKRSYLPDGTLKLQVVCGWDGRCVETLNGEKQAEYSFDVSVDPRTGHLMVQGVELRLVPTRVEQRYRDELVVENDGRTLGSYTVERDGQSFEGWGRPQRFFDKVSDGVADPPAPRHP